MAQQNKNVTIAVIAILGLLAVGAAYFFMGGSEATAPAPVVSSPAAEPPPEAPKEAPKPRAKTRRGSDDAGAKEETKATTANELPPEEAKKRRGPTNQPFGVAP